MKPQSARETGRGFYKCWVYGQHNDILVPVIPLFNDDGNLPVGVHVASWKEVEERFGQNAQRKKLLVGLRSALLLLKRAGCAVVYLDGSFVTHKYAPLDFDLCWAEEGVHAEKLDAVFFDFTMRRRAQKREFGGEIFPADAPGGIGGERYLDFFQRCKRTGHSKGILAIELEAMDWREPPP